MKELTINQLRKAIQSKQCDIDKLKGLLDKKETDLKYKNKPLCNLDYYGVRGGGCSHGDVYNGKVYCLHPKCLKR